MSEVFDNVCTPKPCLVGPEAGPELLNEHFGRRSAVRFLRDEKLGGMVAQLTAGDSVATVALRGAQVLRWSSGSTTDGLLWLSPDATLANDKPVRGGVPICWPWFGVHPTDTSAPSHGFARTASWCVASTAVSDDATCLSLQLSESAKKNAHLPDGAHVVFDVRLGRELKMSLTVVNTGVKPIHMTEALHTYLRVGDISTIRIRGLENKPFLDQLSERAGNSEPHTITFDGEVDRIYNNTAGVVNIDDPKLNRTLRVRKEGSQSTVIWNPWREKAERLGDIGPDGFREIVCVEAGNIGCDEVVVPVGGVHRLGTSISMHPLCSR